MQVRSYHGFQGLHTEMDYFADYVMTPDEVLAFLDDNEINAHYAYPENVAGGFNAAPQFAAAEMEQNAGFHLLAHLTTNRRPKNFLQFIACLILPRSYTAEDHISFNEDNDKGFGLGSCRINSFKFTKANGHNAWLASKLLSVKNRPGLFLKIKNPDGTDNNDIVLFFPAQTDELTHKAVRYGESFVFSRQGVILTPERKQLIKQHFDLLIKPSYGVNNGLFDTTSHTPLNLKK